MEHLLARVGFEVEAVYGDFFRGELKDESADMVWVVRNRQTSTQGEVSHDHHDADPGCM